MGLGPPVCDKCMVIAHLKNHTWSCPVCHSIHVPNNLWEYTTEYQKRFEDNTKFMKFMKGESNGNS